MEIPCWLASAAALSPDHPAVEADGETVAYADLLARADAAARRLAARGVTPGERVALVLPPGLAFAEALHGCWRLGAAPGRADLRELRRQRPRFGGGAGPRPRRAVAVRPSGRPRRRAVGPRAQR